MKNHILFLALSAFLLINLTACNSKTESSASSTPTDSPSPSLAASDDSQSADDDMQNTAEPNEPVESTDSESAKTAPDGDIVDGVLATKENPVPFGTWASVTVSDGGWPKSAYVRILNINTDQTQVQVLIDEYNSKNSGNELLELEEHAEFLDYVVAEYEVFYPSDFSTSEQINTYGLSFSRENNQEDWIASDGSTYYWMGSVNELDIPTRETGLPKNGDTIKCSIIYPMIKGNTDYTLHYKERTEDLSETIDTYFAVE